MLSHVVACTMQAKTLYLFHNGRNVLCYRRQRTIGLWEHSR